MAIATLSLSRRHVLGTLYSRCDAIEGSIPVYLAGGEPDLLGYEHSEPHAEGERGRVKLTSITLVRHKGYDKPVKAVKLDVSKTAKGVEIDDETTVKAVNVES